LKRRQKKQPEGAPLWVVSYGDMMSLLLTFFIMLASMANFDEVHDKFMEAIQSIREALGMTGQTGRMVQPTVDFASMIQRLESIVKPKDPRNRGDTKEEGIYGKNFRLRRIRDGMEITIGGPILFEPFSDQLTEEGKEALQAIGTELVGHRNKIEIRGHAAEEPRPQDWTYADYRDLSYARAVNVANELILRGVDPRTIRVVAVGANEPVAQGVYDLEKRGANRRVEIIVRESLIDDYVGMMPAQADPSTGPEATGDLPLPTSPTSPAGPTTSTTRAHPSALPCHVSRPASRSRMSARTPGLSRHHCGATRTSGGASACMRWMTMAGGRISSISQTRST